MINKKKWEIDIYSRENEKLIVEFTQDDINSRGNAAIFNKDFWEWKYKNNNAGFFPNWIFLAKYREQVIGHYAMLPIYLDLFNKIVLCAQSVDTLTHRDFRGEGIFTSLASRCYKNVMKDGVDIMIGYPNMYSYPGFVSKLNWNSPFVVEELAFVLNQKRVDVMKRSNPLLKSLSESLIRTKEKKWNKKIISSKYHIKNVDKIDFDLKVIKDWLLNKYSCFIERDNNYLKWRYFQDPFNKSSSIRLIYHNDKIKGFYVLKIKNYAHRGNLVIGHIMEILSDPEDKNIYWLMLKDIEKKCIEENVDILHIYTHKTQHDYEYLHMYGFGKFDEKKYIIRINKDFENYQNILDEKKWYVSLGDSDRA